MRTLSQLLASSDGRSFLKRRGVFLEEEPFVSQLRAPAHGGLGPLLGLEAGALPVYAAHQVKVDYSPSVVSKLRGARDLHARNPGVAAVLLWLDMDRAGADKHTTGTQLVGRGGSGQVRLASRRHDDKEVRFVPVDRRTVADAMRGLQSWSRQQGAAAADRAAMLADGLLGAEPATLSQANLALTSFLLREHLAIDAPSALVSDLVARGLLAEAIDDAVDAIDDVVTVFNAAIDTLVAADVDPQVRPLGPDFLPLRYSCDRDDRRCILTHARAGVDHFAVAACACGARYRFHLGTGSLSIGDLTATGRWSADVTLPMYLNDLASGLVAGQSSALYGLVLNDVLEKVMARRPIPMLIPAELPAILAGSTHGGGPEVAPSLLTQYLSGP
jgi:hypothetical protein